MRRCFAVPLLFCALLAVVRAQDVNTTASVYYQASTGSYKVQFGVVDKVNAAAYGSFESGLNVTGWDVLNIGTNNNFDDSVQMYAAGFLEGALTATSIYDNVQNVFSFFFGNESAPASLSAYFDAQSQWTQQQLEANPNDPFWQHVGFIQDQLNGLMDGYNTVASIENQLTMFQFLVLQGTGDLLDLMNVLQPESRVDWFNLKPEELDHRLFQRSLCSALVKVTYDFSDLFAAHSAWFTYSEMNRIYKHYFLDLNAPSTAAKRVSFSSYPGFLESLDDFYNMDSGLTMIQTTNPIFNYTLYDLVKPQSLYAWQRVRVANTMAQTGQQWYQYVSQYNSGTYNNQYMIIDYNLFSPGNPLKDNTLWVVEQVPGLVVGDDLTGVLERGYFASYNVPAFEQIYNISGFPGVVSKYGPEYSYQLAPRAQIFRRDQDTVTDMDSLKALMRYNNYLEDPVSQKDPTKTICSRGDLSTTNPSAGGCYDTKVTNFVMRQSLKSQAINGPTTSHGLPPFSWTGQFASDAHFGEPTTYNFDFVDMMPVF